MFQLKAMDDAISKAEDQVEKFTEAAKETKVLLRNFNKFVMLYHRCLYYCIWGNVWLTVESKFLFRIRFQSFSLIQKTLRESSYQPENAIFYPPRKEKPNAIDPSTVSDAILVGGQTRQNLE